MRKYLKVNIGSGLVEDLSIVEFNNLYSENLNRVENDNGLISYIGKDFILVDDSVIDYDEQLSEMQGCKVGVRLLSYNVIFKGCI